MEPIIIAGITLIAEISQIIAKAIAEKDADAAEVKASADASVQRFLATLGAMPAALAANDAAADEAVK